MNEVFEEIDVKSLPDNVFQLLDEDWMLIAAGNKENFNLMTASWGSFGVLWNKPIAVIFIRPQRYTLSFVENNTCFTLSFFTQKYRKVLNYCGQYSGRTTDKIKATGLTPVLTPLKNIAFEQARMIFECKKIYADNVKSEKFIDKGIIHQIYPSKDFHKIFIGEIMHCYLISTPDA
jgi:flavin reductase (DIM6/NTAB) family NADH-FMN oxidoreductase RutF